MFCFMRTYFQGTRKIREGPAGSPAMSWHQLKPSVRQQVVSPPAPQNRIAEESRNPDQETRDVLQRHQPPQMPHQRIAQGVFGGGPPRDGAEDRGSGHKR